MLSDRVSTPIGHNLMLRPELKDKVKSLRRTSRARSSPATARARCRPTRSARCCEREGLTINDVELKILPFTQMGLAFKNGAIDAGIVIPPFVWQLEEQGLAVPFASVDELVQPQPMTIAVIMANTDWVKANPDLVQAYMTAWLKGVREYCQAYHGGPNRQEVARGTGHQQDRAAPRASGKVSVAGAQPRRQDQHREHARHQQVVREEQDVGAGVSG